jgi:membrane protease YdiL (CAAX protease family)
VVNAGSLRGERGGFRGYLEHSRELSTSLVLVIPLFFFYQVGILLTGGLRNGVDFVTDLVLLASGGNILGYVGFNVVVLLGFLLALNTLRKKGMHPRLIPWMLLESTVYALLLGSVVVSIIQTIGLGGLLAAGADATKPQEMSFLGKLVMSAGAGLYEEIVFRLFLMGGLFLAATKILGLSRFVGAILAILASSVLFSAAHHIAEPFTMSAFTFRVFAGVLFAVIYQWRGLAIAAYTHALYDVWVMVFHHS